MVRLPTDLCEKHYSSGHLAPQMLPKLKDADLVDHHLTLSTGERTESVIKVRPINTCVVEIHRTHRVRKRDRAVPEK